MNKKCYLLDYQFRSKQKILLIDLYVLKDGYSNPNVENLMDLEEEKIEKKFSI